MTEAEELLTDLQAVYGEMFPHRPVEAMPITDTLLAMGVLFRREMRMKQPPACAPLQGTQTLRSFTPRGRILDRMANHNPKDAE